MKTGRLWFLSLLIVVGLTVVAVAQGPTAPPKTSPVSKPTPAAKKSPKPSPAAKPTPPAKTPTPTPVPPPFIIQNNIPIPAKADFNWAKDFPWTALGGAAVIIAALIARDTSERKRKTDKDVADDKLKQDKETAEAREQREAMQFAKKELHDQFVDIENRLASSEPMMRANAALRLAEFGTRLIPRTAKENEADPTPPRNAKNNPYFNQSASQLATALHLEANSAVRKDMVKAFASMKAWAEKEPGQELLHELIHRIAEANRTAKDAFTKAMAEYGVVWVMGKTEEEGETEEDFVASIAPFCEEKATTKIVLQALRGDAEKYAARQTAYRKKWQAEPDSAKEEAARLTALETAAKQLIDTRDALATAMSALDKPADLPEPFVKASKWKRSFPLLLSKAFLAGAYLNGAQLQGADLSEAQLQGADLYGATVQPEDTPEYKKTDFTDSNWSQAEFTPSIKIFQSEVKDQQTAELQEWLKQFSEMPADKVVTYDAWKAMAAKGN